MSQQQVTPSVIASANLNGFAQTAPVDEGQQFDPQIILPDNFEVGKATADGNGFFDSFRQSLEQQRGITVTVEQLRQDLELQQMFLALVQVYQIYLRKFLEKKILRIKMY
uniref:Uncharacterized protein n=1 Tax=Plectus sambesii TaxID=2011161 RepID=A0A914V807_9BILA